MSTSNFSFLQAEWPELFNEAFRAERAALADPRTACFYARRTLELIVVWLFQAEGGRGGSLRMPYKPDLSAFLYEPSFQQLVGPPLHAKMDVIRKLGNNAVHNARPVAAQDATSAVRELFHVAFWLVRQYARNVAARPQASVQFNPALLPKPVNDDALQRQQAASQAAQVAAQEALQKQAEALAERDAALRTAEQRSATLDAELAALRAEVAAAKSANAALPDAQDAHDYNEAATRDLFIDLLLKEAGWALTGERDREYEVTGMPNQQAKGFIDYVLWGNDGKPLAIVEAKRTRRSAKEGEQQAKLYADCLEAQFGQRPVMYGTNGYEHWMWDDAMSPPRAVQGFHKKDELQLMVQRRASRKPLGKTTIDDATVERHYQHRAIRRIGETFERDLHRKALVVMATGAGKTRTVIALVDLLMRRNWCKRVLFLADRVALVNQAVGEFKKHLPASSPVNLVTEKNTEGRVYVCTYPTMMGLIDKGAGNTKRFGIGYFDLIVVDEAHRSIYQKYRAIFSYFDALLVGLTATPKDEIDRNTYSLFELESGVPTDAYGLDDAIAEGFLVPPKAISVPLKFQRQGIRYDDLSEDEKDQWDALEWDEDGTEAPEEVSAEAVNKWLFNIDTVDKVLELLMTRGHKVAGGDRIGKTIVFAKNQRHAEFIAGRFDANYPQYNGSYARIITFKTEYAQSLIDDFSQKDKAPHIAISVDMLDTGIDVPEVLNLVFFKIVRSKAKFWQMVGRGTRLCRDLFAPDQDKKDFLIFDFCQNLEYFSQDLESTDGAMSEPLGQRLFKARIELVGELDKRPHAAGDEVIDSPYLTESRIRKDTAAALHEIVAGMRLDNFVVRPQRRWVEAWTDVKAWERPTTDQLEEAAQHLSGLPTTVRDDDEDAKRFDLLMLRTQLASLRAEPEFERLQKQVCQIAGGLLELTSIPAVREQLPLIEAVAGEEWWEGVTLPMLEQARRKLRALVKLLEKTRRKVVYTDFDDELGELTEIDLPTVSSAVDFERFRSKAKAFLRAHEDRLALHKLRRNQPLTKADLGELDSLLHEAGGTDGDIERARELHKSLPAFVRSLVGLDREAVAQAFAHLIAGTTATASQLQFIDEVVHCLTEDGAMPAQRLYQSPFTDIHSQGPDGVFAPGKVDELFAALDGLELKTA
ncbi:DEAD/DEAH box helicase family protein [Variovorax sp. dw_954]|uniref:DEAD/DEAH box helicase family protein n=1 Tax=Variovorax sp. dw_954 TaxID=2720078 RepID=UPI001BD20216|nr:DEAD/DEAH box helicase family protein [Variovorax sp. dw_954]